MANDRVYLACKACGETTLLFKYYPNGGSYFWEQDEEFLNKHLVECGRGRTIHLEGNPRFVLVAESQFEGDDIHSAKRKILEVMQKAQDNVRQSEQGS